VRRGRGHGLLAGWPTFHPAATLGGAQQRGDAAFEGVVDVPPVAATDGYPGNDNIHLQQIKKN